MSNIASGSRPQSFRQGLAALPMWAKVLGSLAVAHFGFAAAVMVCWLVGTILMMMPLVLLFGAAVFRSLAG